MKTKKEKEMSIKLRNNANKLIIQNPYISRKISGTLIGLSIPIVFMFYSFHMLSSLSYKMTMTKALDSARLVCHRNNVEITCSLTGASLYGNIEKVFSTKKENLIQKVQVKEKLFHAEDDKDFLLVIITNKEEFFLHTQEGLAYLNESKLNNFLINPTISNLDIQTTSSYSQSWSVFFLSLLAGISLSAIFIIPSFIIIYFMIRGIISLIQEILSELNYVFDKESQTLTMQGIIQKSSCLEIPLNRIAKIYLEKHESSSQVLLLIDENNSQVLAIEIFDFPKAQKIACAICSFLEIEPYQIILVPP